MKVEREDLVKEYVELMGSDSEERGFYIVLSLKNPFGEIKATRERYKDYYNK